MDDAALVVDWEGRWGGGGLLLLLGVLVLEFTLLLVLVLLLFSSDGFIMLTVRRSLAESPRTFLDSPHFGEGLVDRFREYSCAADPLRLEPVALPAHLDAVVVHLDHFDGEPPLLPEGADRALDLLKTGREGADVHGRGGVERGLCSRGRVAGEVVQGEPGGREVEKDGVGFGGGAGFGVIA